MLGLIETVVNKAFVDPINGVLKPIKEVKIGWKTNVLGVDIGFELKPFEFINLLDRLCIPYKDIKDCKSEKELADLAALLGCSFDDKSLWKRCYYERVRHSHFEPFSTQHSMLAWGTTSMLWPLGHHFNLTNPSLTSCKCCLAGQVHLPSRGRHA